MKWVAAAVVAVALVGIAAWRWSQLRDGQAHEATSRQEVLAALAQARKVGGLPAADEKAKAWLAAHPGAAAVAYIQGDSRSLAGRHEQLAELFGLLPSEARFALALARGLSIAEAAESLGLTLETARNYSKKVYAKMGARGQADLIITTGGVSAGAYEVVKDAFGRSSDSVEFVKVAMQPGMPQGSGVIDGTPIITFPGNPVSALVSFEVFLRAPLRAAMGLPVPDRPRRTATLTEPLTSPPGRRQFRRGVLAEDRVVSYGPPASHHLRWLASANCLLEIPEDVTQIEAGTAVQVWDLST